MSLKTKLWQCYDEFSEYMQKDTKGVEIGIYTVSGILFAVAYTKIRPITKFGKPSDIPNRFIRTKAKQNGSMAGVDPGTGSGPFVLIDHKPPLHFLVPSRKLLPVQLTGISINSNGYSWLQTVAVEHKVEFVPLAKHRDSAECQVLMLCPHNKRQRLDLSEALLSLGFATIQAPSKHLLEDPVIRRYFKYLQYIEKNAKSERQGLWALSLPPVPWPVRLLRSLYKSTVLQILPAYHRLPELVR